MLKAALLMLFAFASHHQPQVKTPVVIEGRVVTEAGQPVHQAHVFVVDGEEEALTNTQGEFRIKSWQKSPIRVTAEKSQQYQKGSIIVTDPSQKQVIRLRAK